MKPIKKTFKEFLKEYAEAKPNQRYLYNETDSYTVKEAYCSVLNLAKCFSDRGVKAGDYVALSGTRSVETCLLFSALQVMGAVAVMCDPHDSPEEYLKKNGVEISVPYILDFSEGVWHFNGEPLEIPKTQELPAYLAEEIDVEAPAIVIFTSGSTGKTKGVLLSQYNYVNNQINLTPSGGHVHGKDNAIQMLPLFHVFGLSQFIDSVINCCPMFFPKEVTPDYICWCFEKYQITRFGFVPSFAQMLADVKLKKGYNTDSLIAAVLAGAPSTREQFNYIQNTLGLAIVPVYGLSEFVSISAAGPQESDDDRAGSVGKVLSMSEVKITDQGEITVKGPALYLGYLGEEPVKRGEFFHTGDLGYLDEKGFLHVTGRIKDIIIRNGNNLSAARLEEKLLSLPFIKNAAVVGVKRQDCGEAPAAVIVLKDGYKYDEEALKGVFTKIEIPVEVRVMAEIPLTAAGKTDKQKIKELFCE